MAKNHGSKSEPLILILQQMLQQSAKERSIALNLNTWSLLFVYVSVTVILYLDHNEAKMTHLIITGVVGLSILYLISFFRGQSLSRRETQYLKMLSLSLTDLNNNTDPEVSPSGNMYLTARELEILTHIAQGQSDKEIAATLKLSQYTVRNHLRNIYLKLDVKDRTSAVILALKSGWIKLNENEDKEATFNTN